VEKVLNTLSGMEAMAQEGFSPEPTERTPLELPLPETFAEEPLIDSRRLWGAFRTPKHFFEKEGAMALREELNELLFCVVDAQLSTLQQQWEDIAAASLMNVIHSASQVWSDQLTAFAVSMSHSLEQPGEERFIADFQEQWRKIRQ
jgi:hypothetical protein